MTLLQRIAPGLFVLALAACGGGGDQLARIGGGGSGAPPSAGAGTVSGFGSIFIGGVRYDDTGAKLQVDEKPDAPTAVSVDAVRLGMQIQFENEAARLTRATVAAEVLGPVSSVTAGGLVVLGQSVRINGDAATPTVFEGFSSIGELAMAAMIEVHGQRTATGEAQATRIALRPATSPLRVAGTVSDLGSGSFRIGALTVRSNQASIVPAGQTLANGQRVAVWSDQPLAAGEFVARAIRIGTITLPASATLSVDGVITDYQSAASLRVNGFVVDAGSAQFAGGSAADLRNSRIVRVTGLYAAGVLRATRIEFVAPAAPMIEVSGSISGFVDAASAFQVRSTAVRVTPQTAYVDGGAANLGDGTLVKVEGLLINGSVEATRITLLPLAANISRVLFGSVTEPFVTNGALRSFRLAPLPYDVAATAATRYKKGAVTDLAPGRSVKVDGTYDGTRLVADEIQFTDNTQDPPTVSVDGIASNVQTGSVVVNGTTVMLTPATSYRRNDAAATFADLRNGLGVEIDAVRINGQLVASVVDIKAPASGTASVRGIVSGRATPTASEFLVGSQRVSVAAGPKVIPGSKSIADIRNGNELEVDGTLANGLLTATRIKFR
jgi:hypothetical protein